jgi:lipid-binding SYLF domain-containing protein
MKRLQVMIAALAIHILCISPLAVSAEQYPASGSAAAPGAATSGSAAQTLETASQVFDRMFTSGLTPEERAKVDAVLKDAYGFVVLPNVLKVGIGLTQIHGRGVLVYRDAKGVWQPPIPLLVSGQGIGPHFGLIAYDALIPS